MTNSALRMSFVCAMLVLVAFGAFATGSSEPAMTATAAEELRVFIPTARPETEYSDEVKAWIEDEIGVSLEYTRVPVDSWQQKLTLALAGGDVFDVIRMPDPAFYYEYARQGAFYDLTDSLTAWPNLVAYGMDMATQRLPVDGRIYGVPILNTEGKNNLYMRGDWLDALDMDVPETLNDLTDVLRAFTLEDPDGNGADDTYGYGNADFMPFYGAFGVFPSYHSLSGNRVVTHSISDEYKRALMYLRDLYADGYLHPEVFIMDANQSDQQFVNGVTGSFTGWWSNAGTHIRDLDFKGLNPGGEIIQIAPPAGPDGSSGMQGRNNLFGIVSLHEATEKAETALKFLDWATSDYGYRTLKYGIEGVNWTMDNGNISYLYTNEDWTDLQGRPNKYDEAFIMFERPDIYPEQIATPSMVYFYSAYQQATFNNPLIRDLFVGIATDEFARLNADVQALEREMRIKYIMGEASFDGWEPEYVSRWKSIGGEAVRQSLLQAYNEQHGTSYSFRD